MKTLTDTPKKYRGAIFDLDGTLLNTIADLSDSVNAAMSAMNCPTYSESEIMQMVGNGFKLLITRALPEERRTEKDISEGLRLFDEAYARRYAEKTAPYPGIPALLTALSAKGVLLGVDSNKRDDYTKTLISQWFPNTSFIDVYGEREKDGIPKKPHPAAALALAAKMGLPPDEVLFVGDSRPDMETGRNAGMDCAGVTWGFRSAQELADNGASYLIDRPEEMPGLF